MKSEDLQKLLADLNPHGARQFMDTLAVVNFDFAEALIAEIASCRNEPEMQAIALRAEKPCEPGCRACPLGELRYQQTLSMGVTNRRTGEAWYDKKLFEEAAKGPLTADEIGMILKGLGSDAVTRLRARRSVSVTIVGTVPGRKGRKRRLYKVERVPPTVIEE